MKDVTLNFLEELALSYGLIEEYYSPNSTNKPKTNEIPKQKFYQYLIVIDFESTCWEKSEVKWHRPEIIEFPAILINLATGKIISEFHQYVMPVEAPKLSDFCIKLTGITQNIIDKNGIPIQTALMLFDNWLNDMIEIHSICLPKTNRNQLQGNCAFATWSDWDLGVCLNLELERKHIKKHSYFDQWIDVRSTYKTFYNFNPKNFSDALNNVEMNYIGRPHSGIDDARNISRLTHKMAKQNAQFVITKDLKPYIIFNKN